MRQTNNHQIEAYDKTVLMKVYVPLWLREEVTVRAIRLRVKRSDYIQRLVLFDMAKDRETSNATSESNPE